MSSSDGDLLGDLLAEHASLERELADPAVHTDQSRARRLGRRYAQLAPLVETSRALEEARGNLATARELAGEDASFAAEATALEGYKDVAVAVKSRTDEGIWSRLKFEGGVHRVQRVPVTESQGRIHTSAAGVLVLPEAEEVDVSVDPNDLRIDVFRSSGPGGQSVNTTDSAVRITHLPSGIVVSCQNEKSQLQNRESALRILRSRLLVAAREEAAAAASDQRRSQVRTVDRSERVRTYNFAENRISDPRRLQGLQPRPGARPRAHRRAADGRLLNTRTLLADAARRLAEAGVESPRVDAELLLAFALG